MRSKTLDIDDGLPDFELANHRGESVHAKALHKSSGAAVLVFYRGHW